jgi:hypothetical protein
MEHCYISNSQIHTKGAFIWRLPPNDTEAEEMALLMALEMVLIYDRLIHKRIRKALPML